jgi:nucleotide-binding universal stress UspA family protein
VSRPKKILVAYDGSSQSKEALNWAIDLNLLSGAPIIAVKVVEPVEMNRAYALYEAGYGATLEERFAEMHKIDVKQMNEAVEVGRKQGVEIKTEMLRGNVGGGIIDYAIQNGVDLIVAGTKGHGALEELLMGSVTRNLVSLSPIPVLIVKETAS